MSEQHPELRVSDADREATVVRLREAGGEGRLTLEELADRVEHADAARTRGDLEALTADLPVAAASAAVLAADAPRKERRWVVAIMGGEQRKGRWRPSKRTNAIAVMGGVDIVRVRAFSLMGGVVVERKKPRKRRRD